MLGFWTIIWGHVRVERHCCHQGHTDLGGMCCFRAPELLPRAMIGFISPGVCDDVHGLCYHRGHRNHVFWNWRVMLSQSYLTGPGIASPAPHWTLHEETWPCHPWELIATDYLLVWNRNICRQESQNTPHYLSGITEYIVFPFPRETHATPLETSLFLSFSGSMSCALLSFT